MHHGNIEIYRNIPKDTVIKNLEKYNKHTQPFVWTVTADSILEKIKRLCQCISETRN